MSAIDRLEELLREAEEKAENLEEKLHSINSWAEYKWTIHSQIENDALPVPRIEMQWDDVSGNWYERTCTTSIIYPHFLGYSVKVPIDRTKVSGGKLNCAPDPTDFPFRQGAHFCHEAKVFGWPAFIRIGSTVWRYIGRDEEKCPIVSRLDTDGASVK